MSSSVNTSATKPTTRVTTGIMWGLLGLFAFRIAAQFMQVTNPVSFLPHFEAWQSDTLSYEVLLGLQSLILVVMGAVTCRLTKGWVQPSRRMGKILLSFGAIYFGFMAYRFGAALTFADEHSFMGKALPAFFHLVLSAWMLLWGSFHYRGNEHEGASVSCTVTMVRWLSYPLLMAFGLWLHFALQGGGLGLQLSTYIPVVVGAMTISFLERFYPYRAEWQPDHKEVKSDLTFMVLVQILLPKMLAFFVAITALEWLGEQGVVLRGWWPHDFPPVAQATLMILAADFLRYWLHRASHEWSPRLWRLHAVHHSPHKLYWVNVGRFHPIEKSLQFLCDALPFILLGISADVLAIYFVFYAINGFFQHSNVDLRLGGLNYLISGPELHRWHHSWESRESNKNYGNNLIVWDLMFGSFFLPDDREVGHLGLRNRNYPRGFIDQMKTPFVKGADQTEK